MYIINYVEQHLFLYGLVIQNYLRFEDFNAIVWAEKKRKHIDVFVTLIPWCLLFIFPNSSVAAVPQCNSLVRHMT